MVIAPEHHPYEVLPAPLCVLRDGLLVYANAAFGALLGLDREAVVGRTIVELTAQLVAEEDRQWVTETSQRVQQGERNQPPVLWMRLAIDSAPRMIHCLQAEGPREGDFIVVLQPAESERRVSAFTASLASGAAKLMRCRDEEAVLDSAVQILFDNGLWANVMLVKGDRLHHGPMRHEPGPLAAAEALYGKPMTEVTFALADLPHVEEVLRTGRGIFHHDFNAFTKRLHPPEVAAIIDTLPPVQALDAPIIVGTDKLGILSAIGPGLSPAMGAAVELFAQHVSAAVENARAHKLLRERLVQLETLQSELVEQERLAALGEAAAVMAHEVRNPLGAILNGFALLKRSAPELQSEARRALAMAEEEAHRLDALIHDLLDFTRPMFPKPTALDVTELLRRSVQIIRDRSHDDGVKFEIDAQRPHVIMADAQLLQLALQNLLRNAVQASPRNGTVRVSIEAAANAVRVAIEDQGSGVSAADAERIFDPFFTTRATGTGLGLPMVRRVAEAHRGKIEVRAGDGGARFELTLPGC